MTNKLPVVGKRYRHKKDDTLVATVLGNFNKVKFVACWDNKQHNSQGCEMLLESFYENYEELPEDIDMDETEYLFSSPQNKKRILSALNSKGGKTYENLAELENELKKIDTENDEHLERQVVEELVGKGESIVTSFCGSGGGGSGMGKTPDSGGGGSDSIARMK